MVLAVGPVGHHAGDLVANHPVVPENRLTPAGLPRRRGGIPGRWSASCAIGRPRRTALQRRARRNPGVLRTCRSSVFYLHSNVGSSFGGRMESPYRCSDPPKPAGNPAHQHEPSGKTAAARLRPGGASGARTQSARPAHRTGPAHAARLSFAAGRAPVARGAARTRGGYRRRTAHRAALTVTSGCRRERVHRSSQRTCSFAQRGRGQGTPSCSPVGARKSAHGADLLLRHRREHGMIQPWRCG